MFEKLCRLCGALKEDLMNVLDGTSLMQKVQWQLHHILHIKIEENDVLPTGICTSCMTGFQRTMDFISYCHCVQKTLKDRYEAFISNGSTNYDASQKFESRTSETDITNTGDSYSCDQMIKRDESSSSGNQNAFNVSSGSSCRADVESNTLSNFQCNFNAQNGKEGPSPVSSINIVEKFAKLTNEQSFTVPALNLFQNTSENDKNNESNQNYDMDYSYSDDNTQDTFDHSEESEPLPQLPVEVSISGTSDNPRKSKDFTGLFTIDDLDASRREKKNLTCEFCNVKFTQKLPYEEHLNIHTGNRPYVCKTCMSTFRKRQELRQHIRTVHSGKEFKCSLCPHIAKHKGKLTEHIKSIHEKPFRCSMCSYRTGEKAKIVTHIANKHSTELSFVCEICGNGFKTNTALHNHQQNIHFPQPKICPNCGIVCPSISKFNSHIFRCSNKKNERFACEVCHQTYVNKEILRDHMNKHLNIKPYKCEDCGKEFHQRNRLDSHKFVHRGPSFQCSICNMSFKRKDNMRNHVKKHAAGDTSDGKMLEDLLLGSSIRPRV